MGHVHRFEQRPDLLPGAVVSAVAYASSGLEPGEHRGLPSPWITFIVAVDGPVRVSGTVEDGAGFDPADVPEDRLGLRESVVARMGRVGGSAHVRSQAGEGTEVSLVLPAALGARSVT